MNALREQARHALHVYTARSGLTLPEIAQGVGYSPYSLRQFSSGGHFGDGDGHVLAAALMAWFHDNPLPTPRLPGKLYETRATREMDGLLQFILEGGWGVLYGPAGARKTFFLEYRWAESARESQSRIVYIRCSPAGMTANVFLRRIAAQIGAPFGQYTDGIRNSVLYAISRRSDSLALVLDEADALYRWVETLETLREIGDLARARPGQPGLGILVAGNERVMQIFENRRGISLEKWRGRIQQRELRVLGPSAEEAACILREELPELKDELLRKCVTENTVSDPISGKHYVNMHRLFNTIRLIRRAFHGGAVGKSMSPEERGL
jgi:DNA transposition AAA+ family ATPase